MTTYLHRFEYFTIQELKEYLEDGNNINAVDDCGKTIFHYKILDTETIIYAIENGFNPNIKDYNLERTIFHERYWELLQFAISKGLDFNLIDRDGNTIFNHPSSMILEPLNFAIKNGFKIPKNFLFNCYIDENIIIDYLLETDFDFNWKNEKGNTAFHFSRINRELILKLVNAGRFDINAQNNVGDTIFHHYIKGVELFDTFDLSLTDNRGNTVLHIDDNDISILRKLKNFPINTQNIIGNTIFHIRENKKEIQYGLNNGFDPNIKNKKGETIFHKPHSKGNLLTAIKKGFDINTRDNDGNTVFHNNLNLPALRQCVKRGFDITAINNNGETILHTAKDVKWILKCKKLI